MSVHFTSGFEKYDSMVLLQEAGFITPGGVFIPPGSNEKVIRREVESYSNEIGAKHLVLRSDGGPEAADYVVGGGIYETSAAIKTVIDWSRLRRAVILMPPLNRYKNSVGYAAILDRGGSFVVEIVGLGYDVGDLNRGIVTGQVRLTAREWIDSNFQSRLRHIDLLVQNTEPDEESRRQLDRLRHIAERHLGHDTSGLSRYAIEALLIRSNVRIVFGAALPAWRMRDINQLWEAAHLALSRLGGRSRVVCVTAARVAEMRGLVFFDAVDASKKWALKCD